MSGDVTRLMSVPRGCGLGSIPAYFSVIGSNSLQVGGISVSGAARSNKQLHYRMTPSEQVHIT